MKTNQIQSNPFQYTSTNKRYYTYDHYLKTRFGGKVAKISLDCGFTCPNIDGRRGVGGCIYCSDRGSGDFAESPLVPLHEQYQKQFLKMRSKWETNMSIPYFQAHTNTYADIHTLKKYYNEALNFDGVVGMNIATRADCLPDDVLTLLSEIAEKTVLTVELGLQSVHEKTAKLINRCHTYKEFVDGFTRLRSASKNINVCIHLIEGLPGETHEMMLESALKVAKLSPDQVKFHSMNVISNTPLHKMYLEGKYHPIEMEEYIKIVCDSLEVLPPHTVIGRITGDADRKKLAAPLWSLKKTEVINNIDKELFKRNSYQGIYFKD